MCASLSRGSRAIAYGLALDEVCLREGAFDDALGHGGRAWFGGLQQVASEVFGDGDVGTRVVAPGRDLAIGRMHRSALAQGRDHLGRAGFAAARARPVRVQNRLTVIGGA